MARLHEMLMHNRIDYGEMVQYSHEGLSVVAERTEDLKDRGDTKVSAFSLSLSLSHTHTNTHTHTHKHTHTQNIYIFFCSTGA
jgi:hypothetical protein